LKMGEPTYDTGRLFRVYARRGKEELFIRCDFG
jgi:hypothetical protein